MGGPRLQWPARPGIAWGMGLFDITRWPALLVFLLAGAVAVCFAFTSVNLFAEAMASARFLRGFGAEAVRHGALWQVGELLLWGGLALVCWLIFKICEAELADRYRAWARKRRDDAGG